STASACLGGPRAAPGCLGAECEGHADRRTEEEMSHPAGLLPRGALPTHAISRSGKHLGAPTVPIRMALLFGFHMPNFTHPGVPDERLFERVVEQARAAEAAGFDLVTVMDHFYQIAGI